MEFYKCYNEQIGNVLKDYKKKIGSEVKIQGVGINGGEKDYERLLNEDEDKGIMFKSQEIKESENV